MVETVVQCCSGKWEYSVLSDIAQCLYASLTWFARHKDMCFVALGNMLIGPKGSFVPFWGIVWLT